MFNPEEILERIAKFRKKHYFLPKLLTVEYR